MAKTVVGLFDTFAEAQDVVQELVNSGFRREEVSLVANDAKGEYRQYANAGTTTADGETTKDDAVGAGAVSGTVIGGVLGLLVGTGLLIIPGIGPVLAAGPLAAGIGSTATAVGATALGAGIGAAAGGLVGGLVGAGVPEEDANYYAEGVRRGGALVAVATDDMNVDRAYSVMQQHGAVDIKQRGAGWREQGWNRFDPEAEPYRSEGAVSRTTGEPYRRSDDPGAMDYTGSPGDSTKAGAAVGGLGGAATGAAIGAVGGPVGAVVGGAIGAVAGGALGAAGGAAFETYDADFRTHYLSSPHISGKSYDYYTPGYRFGYDLSRDSRYSSADWGTVEPEARRRWEAEHPNTWEQFKDVVRYSWDKTRGTR